VESEALLLGIDIGTSKVAAAIAEPGGRCLATRSVVHRADIAADAGRAEQDVGVLFGAARQAVGGLDATLRARIGAVGVTGQMHGVVLLDDTGRAVGPLITWQDGRCDSAFLQWLADRTGYRLSSGYGCATLAWVVRHKDDVPTGGVVSAATIHDLLAARLVGAQRPVIDPTDAASWGLFDLWGLQWDVGAVEAAGIPTEWLPRVVPCGACVGYVTAEQAGVIGVRAGIPVVAAIGDNPASLLATLDDPEHDIGLTLGTGGQLSVVVEADDACVAQTRGARGLEPPASFEIRPFPGWRYVAVAASLCGGAAWRWLAETAIEWMRELGCEPPPTEQMYERLNTLGLEAETPLEMDPTLAGERHDPHRRGCLRGIGTEPMRLGQVARAVARGIVENLRGMLPAELFTGRRRVMASGNALRRNPVLRAAAAEVLGLPVVLSPYAEEAACGVALNAAGLLE